MTSRKIVAVFDTRDAAERARNSLLDLGLPGDRINLTDQRSSERTVQQPEAHGTFWSHLKEMFMPEHDRNTYQESMRRGGCVLAATVDEANVDQAITRVEQAGPIDLEQRAAEWRSQGWNPAAATNKPMAASAQGSTAQSSEGAKIPVVEEKLRVGKREVNRGTVRVRSYIVEEPVHEEVRLRDEHVNVERRPVDAPTRPVAKGSPEDLLQERTVEVSETAEQAVVGKEARVTEEVVVGKSADERTERIDDSVRKTKVDIEDNRNPNRPAQPGNPNSPRPTR